MDCCNFKKMMMPKESKLATIAAHTGRSSSRHLSIQISNHHQVKRSGGLALLPLSMSNMFLLIVIIIMIVPASSFVLPPSHTCTSATVMTTDELLSSPVVSIFSSSQSLTATATAKIQCWMSTSSSSTPEVTGTEAQRETTKEVITDKKNTKSNETRKILERAKALIAVSRAKIEAQEQEEAALLLLEDKNDEDEKADKKSSKKNMVPFFASSSTNSDIDNIKKTEKVIKNKNEDTGLFTTDGDLMANLSEEEEWESRSLLEVVEKTVKSKNVDRDIAKSIYNLRKSLQTSDFMKIFDTRNRFIGDP